MGDAQDLCSWSESREEVLRSQYPLHCACRDGDLGRLREVLLGVDGDDELYKEDSFYGWTPAHWAAYFGKLTCLMHLDGIGLFCDVVTERFNQSPVHIGAYAGHAHCLKWLLQIGAAINRQLACLRKLASVGGLGTNCDIKKCMTQQTPSHVASYAGHPHCLQWLLQSGADIEMQDYLGETPVHKAARTGSMECCRLLVSQGSKLSIQNYSGLTPSQLAMSCGFRECANFLEQATQTSQQAKDVFDNFDVSGNIKGHAAVPTILDQPEKGHLEGLNDGAFSGNGNRNNQCFATTSTEVSENQSDMDIEEGVCNVSANTVLANPGIQPGWSDVLMDHGVCHNYKQVGGRKRTREDYLDEECFKRMRRTESNQSDSLASACNNILSSYNAILSVSTEPLQCSGGGYLINSETTSIPLVFV